MSTTSGVAVPTGVEVSFTKQEDDIYGQVHPIETAQLVEQKLKELDVELDKLAAADSQGWRQAKTKCPELVDGKFKLQFLRCEVFHVDLAAKRIAKYWEERVRIFGPSKAFLPLTQKDSLQDDQAALEISFFRLTGTTDATGRRIAFADPSRLDKTKYTRESMARTVWYVVHAALEDETTQRLGMVFVLFPHHAKLAQFDRKLAKLNMAAMQGCLPVRLSAFHIVHPPSFFAVIFGVIRLFLHDRVKRRVMVHRGSEEDVLAALSQKGLTADALPIDIGGKVVLDQSKWLEARRQQEGP